MNPDLLRALRLEARRLYRDWEFGEFSHAEAEQRSRAKEMLYLAQDGLCPLCGHTVRIRHIDNGWRARFEIAGSLDHVFPRSRAVGDGYDRIGNFVLAHRQCNTDKGDRAPRACEIIYLRYVNTLLEIPTPFIILKGVDRDRMNEVSYVRNEETQPQDA